MINMWDIFGGGQKDKESSPMGKLGLEIARDELKQTVKVEPKEEKSMENQIEPGKEESAGEATVLTQDEMENESSSAQEPENINEDETIEFKPFNPGGQPEDSHAEEATEQVSAGVEEEPGEEAGSASTGEPENEPETAAPEAETESVNEPEADSENDSEPVTDAESEPEPEESYNKEEIEKERQALLQEEIIRTQAREQEALEENYIEMAEHSGISPKAAALMALVAFIGVLFLVFFGIQSFQVANTSIEEADNRYLALTSKFAEHKEPAVAPPAETSGISAELSRSAATLDKIIALNDPELSPRASELKNEVNAAIAALKAEPGDLQKAGAPQE